MPSVARGHVDPAKVRAMKTLAGAAVAAAMLVGCGSGGSTTAPAPSAGEQAAALAAANAYQRAFLARDAEAACDLLTGEAKRGLADELEISTDREVSLKTAFDLFGPEDDAKLRRAIRTLDDGDVSVDGDAATVALPSDRALKLQRVEGRWYVADTNTNG